MIKRLPVSTEPPPAAAIEAETFAIPGKDKVPFISVLPVICKLPVIFVAPAIVTSKSLVNSCTVKLSTLKPALVALKGILPPAPFVSTLKVPPFSTATVLSNLA